MSHAIVVATDLSAAARSAMKQAARIADRDNASLHVVCVVDRDETGHAAKATGISKEDAEKRLTTQARNQLDQEIDSVQLPTSAHRHIKAGSPAKEIAGVCQEVNASLLIMGYHGRGEPGGGPGGVARACARIAPCSVLIHRAGHDGPFATIVAAADFSTESDTALEAAASFAKADNAELTLIHAYTNPYESPFLADSGMMAVAQLEQYTTSLLMDLKSRADQLASKPAKPIRTELIASADAAKAIASFARTHHADLTVMGAIGRSAIRHFLMGSTSDRVLAHSHSSVLVVRPHP